MPWGLRRYQQTQQLHFITFSCYRRQPCLTTDRAKRMFEEALERARRKYGLLVFVYVVMPEHVHLLVSEPQRDLLSTAMQAIKQSVARRMIAGREHFWQARYYDFNICSQLKINEKLRYMHRNPVKRGLVERPEDWPWSSFRHYLTGEIGAVEIESEWTWRRRRTMGIELKMRVRENPRPTRVWLGGVFRHSSQPRFPRPIPLSSPVRRSAKSEKFLSHIRVTHVLSQPSHCP